MTTSAPSKNIQSFLRVWQITGCKRRKIEPLIPVCRSTFLAKVKSGEWPQPVHLTQKTTAWRAADIHDLCTKLAGVQ